MNELFTRAIFGGIYVAIIIAVLRFGEAFAPILFFLFSALCFGEVIRLSGFTVRQGAPWLFLIFLSIWFSAIFPNLGLYGLGIAFLSATLWGRASKKHRKALLRVLYVLQPFVIATVGIQHAIISAEFVLFVFAVIWLNDTGAYLSGKNFGKTPLAPAISPKKTWEGFLGGILLAVLGQWILFPFLFANHAPLKASLLAIFIGTAATMGDLIQSRMKRKAGVKDSGNILPGHGGAFDRLDSFIFALPVSLFLHIAIPGLQ
ncbi:MAG: phosphatidate cytidylyltransferase [Cryomorphaceae bacterium]|nr:phosphatidate cytidylyltransferase [Cryomorphaceae bacterium]